MMFSFIPEILFLSFFFFFFFFNDTATTEIYTLSLHDALPIPHNPDSRADGLFLPAVELECVVRDRKSTRLNSSHVEISYAVFCLKKKKKSRLRLSTRKTQRKQT